MSTPWSRSLAPRGAVVLAAIFAMFAVLGTWGSAPAEATSYRFWGYWLGADDGWSFSSQGASRRPADGTVDGWRFAVSEASSSTTPPRHTSSFQRICGSTAAAEGSKRVGLVVDFGTASDAPDDEAPAALISTCVVAPDDANGYEVLDLAGVSLRTDSGLICGINGYPATECGTAVADPTPSPSAGASDDGGSGSGSTPGGAGGSSDVGGNQADEPGDAQGSGSTGGTADGEQGQEPGDSGSKRGDQGKEQKKSQPVGGDPTPEETALAASPAAAATGTGSSGSPVGMAVGVGVVVALLATAYVLRRRRA